MCVRRTCKINLKCAENENHVSFKNPKAARRNDFISAVKVVQQQKAECSQKLEGLTMWLAGAASLLANQKVGAESGDVNELQQKQKELKVR